MEDSENLLVTIAGGVCYSTGNQTCIGIYGNLKSSVPNGMVKKIQVALKKM